MTCVKNGAKIYFENYGMSVVGDVYLVGDCWIFRWNTQYKVYGEPDSNVTHYIHRIVNSAGWWHRDDLGLTVVPNYLVTAYGDR